MSTRRRICLTTALLSAGAVRTSAAQTWVGEKGEASLALQTSYQWADTTYEGDLRITGVPAQSMRNSVGVTYVPFTRLQLEGSIVLWQLDRYTGPQMGAPGVLLAHGDNDDGDWHGTVSDAQLGARYQLLEGDFAVTPLIRVKIPASDYEERGYAATGNGLIEASGGFYIGKLGLFHERVFAQAGYLFTWVQKQDQGGDLTEEFSTHNSFAHADAGALLGEDWTVALMTDFLWTHGGFNLIDIQQAPDPVYQWHDSVLQRKFVSLGAAVGYNVVTTLQVSLAASVVLWGDNVSNARALSLGLDWTFLSGGG